METKQNAILEQGTAHNYSIVTADSSKTTMTKEVIPDIAISNTTTEYETVTACEAINMDTGKESDKMTDLGATKFISKVSFYKNLNHILHQDIKFQQYSTSSTFKNLS